MMNRNRFNVSEVRYFHPTGRSLPNGSHYQKGGFIAECKHNADAFVLSNDMNEYRGGAIVLAEREISVNAGGYMVGNFFHGKYVGICGEVYDHKSICVAAAGLSSASLLNLAEVIADDYGQKTLLVKDLNRNKILYMVKQ